MRACTAGTRTDSWHRGQTPCTNGCHPVPTAVQNHVAGLNDHCFLYSRQLPILQRTVWYPKTLPDQRISSQTLTMARAAVLFVTLLSCLAATQGTLTLKQILNDSRFTAYVNQVCAPGERDHSASA